MTFSARDAVLNDDEEWFNIPAVVRSFLRQLNNEVQNNRLACDTLLQSQREQDGLLKGVASKQMEREFQMTKTVLALQQDRQEDQTSLRELVENMRDQMRHLSEEQQLMRDRVRRMEEREQEAIAMHDSLRAQSTSLSKALNGRSVELETLLHRSVGELSKGFGELEKEVRLISTKQTDMVVESRGELERFNAALQQLCGAVSEEVDSLRAQVQGQERSLEDLKSFSRECEGKVEKQVRVSARLREKVSDAVAVIKQVETSSDERFESVFSALEKTQVLTNKLSVIHQQRGEDHSSLKTILEETRDTHSTLTRELQKTLDEQSRSHEKEFMDLKGRVRYLEKFNDEEANRLNEDVTVARFGVEEAHRRLDALEIGAKAPNLREEMKDLLKNALTNERMTCEKGYMELNRCLLQQKNALFEEIERVKTAVGDMDTKCELARSSVRRTDDIGESVQALTKQVGVIGNSFECMREDIDIVKNAVKAFEMRPLTMIDSDRENKPHTALNQLKETRNIVTDADLEEVRALVEQIQYRLNTHDNQMNEMHRDVLRYETLVKEIPRSYQRYMETVDEKLSPALLELDVLRKRMASFELEQTNAQRREGMHSSPPTASHHEDDELEGIRVKLQQNQAFQSTQRQVQAMDVRLDSLQAHVQSLERKLESISREISDVSGITAALQEKEDQSDKFLRNEMKRVFLQLHELEEGVKNTERNVSSKQMSLQAISGDVKALEASMDTASAEVRMLEKALKGCVMFTSLEWKELGNEVSVLSRHFQEAKPHISTTECETFAPLSRVSALEEALAQLHREQQEFVGYVEQAQKSMIEGTHLETLRERSAEIDRLLPVLEKRLDCVEEAVRRCEAQMVANAGDALTSLGARLQTLEVSVSELQARQPSTPSSSASSSSSIAAVSSVLDRVAASEVRLMELEGALHDCTRGVAKSTDDVKACEGRLQQVEARLLESRNSDNVEDAATAATDCRDALSAVVGRLESVEASAAEFLQAVRAQQDELHAHYTRAQLDARFESLWASFIALLTRKEDQETVEERLRELRRGVTEDVAVQVNTAVRELRHAIEERVSVTEVRELLRGMRE